MQSPTPARSWRPFSSCIRVPKYATVALKLLWIRATDRGTHRATTIKQSQITNLHRSPILYAKIESEPPTLTMIKPNSSSILSLPLCVSIYTPAPESIRSSPLPMPCPDSLVYLCVHVETSPPAQMLSKGHKIYPLAPIPAHPHHTSPTPPPPSTPNTNINPPHLLAQPLIPVLLAPPKRDLRRNRRRPHG